MWRQRITLITLEKMAKKTGVTLLISQELLALHSPISKNVGVDRVYPFLALAQEYYIAPILGRPLMEELQNQIETSGLTEENKALILKIAPCLAFYTSMLACRGLGYSFTQKGLTKERSENSEALNEKELGEYILSLKNQSEMYKELLVKFLCQCQELYPSWRPESDCHCSKYLEPDEGRATTERQFLIYFPKQRRDGCCH